MKLHDDDNCYPHLWITFVLQKLFFVLYFKQYPRTGEFADPWTPGFSLCQQFGVLHSVIVKRTQGHLFLVSRKNF